MDFMYLLGQHAVSINPLSLLILAWLWRVEQKIQQVILNATRREELLNDVAHVIDDIKKMVAPQKGK